MGLSRGTRVLGPALPSVGSSPAPGTTEAIQHGIFAYFVPPVALYALLGAIMWLSKDRKEETE